MYYLASNAMQDKVLEKLLAKKSCLFDVKIMSLKSYLNERLQNPAIDLVKLHQKLQALPLKDFQKAIDDISFLSELQDKRQKLAAYNVDLKTLDINKEYRLLLENTDYLPYFELKELFRKEDFSDFVIYDGAYELYEREFIAIMVEKGAKFIPLEPSNKGKYYLSIANLKEGLDKVAHFILEKKIDPQDVAIIASSDDLSFLRIHLKRLGLPYYDRKGKSLNIMKRFCALLDYYFAQDLEHFIALVKNSECVNLALLTYLEKHAIDYLAPYDHLKDEDSYYQKMEEKAQNSVEKYRQIALKFQDVKSYEEALVFSFEVLKDQKDAAILKKEIEEFGNYEADFYPYLRERLLSYTQKTELEGIELSSYPDASYYHKYLFLLNPHLDHYPGTFKESGVLNELSLKNTNYPSLLKRYENLLKNFDYLTTNEYVYALLGSANFEGKSLEYDNYFSSFTKIDNREVKFDRHEPYNYHPTLKKELAAKLFFPEGELRASVSSLERYMACNFAYFLNRGLGLLEPAKKELNNILVGNTIHKIMERAIKKAAFKKDYHPYLDDQVILNALKEQLDKIYPGQKEAIDAFVLRIQRLIQREIPFISDMEKHTLFKPEASEFRFDDIFFTYDGIDLRLKGSIDRIDRCLGYFRILDYKTSKQTLSLGALCKGQKLQLVTYAYIYQKISKLKPALVAYLNIHHETEPDYDYYFSLRDGLALNDQSDKAGAYFKNHRLEGIFFEFLDDFDDDQRHIAFNSRKLLPFEKVAEALEDIFSYIITRIKEAKIDIAPDDKECDYCPYHTICHFKGVKGLDQTIITTLEKGEQDET